MTLTVLSESDVFTVLHRITSEDIQDIQSSLADALHYYSTAGEENLCCSSYQPSRTTLKRKDGKTTLFMPASANSGLGFKVVTLPSPAEPNSSSISRLSLTSSERSHSPRPSVSSQSTSSSAPFQAPASVSSAESTTPKGSLTLLASDGTPTAMINAEEITAFRTALASNFLIKKRQSVHDVTIFGAGKQAYWHARIALLMRGEEIHHLNVVNRSFDRARELMMKLYNPLPGDENYVNTIGHKYNSKTKTAILTPTHPEYERLLKEYVRAANVIFCTTPSTEPLFPASYLTNPEGRKKGRYIALVGSYRPHMIELHPDILKQAVAPHHEHRHFHKHQREGGAIVVDSLDACLKEAGELIQAKIQPHQVVELGELVMLRRDAEQRRAKQKLSQNTDDEGIQVKESDGLRDWLFKGNVILKTVGMGLMDVVVGHELVRLAREMGIGTVIENF
ncbi:NAD(P)-binding protein [Myriangium duriaei CBS 260.36]|uniref:NAD(P)-binding protein n=1 Tax=Myriangium duriaei CBS 260.36 TaxID=1168546 RepID=A0A9P4J656_9PEZI|nr:NAD(P)-binding protein [Myriangium duriaei CBS 260.36]